jgi:hypothetical protein
MRIRPTAAGVLVPEAATAMNAESLSLSAMRAVPSLPFRMVSPSL